MNNKMTLQEIADQRFINQQIASSDFHSARELVSWMGAIQAQDFAMAKWAVGLRLPGLTDQMIESAINEGEIIRTHVLRPTWQLVAPEDIYWMLELSAPQIKTTLRSRHKNLGLTEEVIKKSNKVIKKTLSGKNHLLRQELAVELEKIGISNDNNRLAHVLLHAETEGLICSGKLKGNNQTYALLEERVAGPGGISHEKALEKLAAKYFSSHGPATLKDFTWWSGLSVKEARSALEIVKNDLVSFSVDSATYWTGNFMVPAGIDLDAVHLLPAYDEFLISYADRSASLPVIYNKKTVSENGIFRPVIVRGGQVIGLWKKSSKKDFVEIEAGLFKPAGKELKYMIKSAAEKFGIFINKKIKVNFSY